MPKTLTHVLVVAGSTGAAALLLAGCSSAPPSKAYSTVGDLKSAYVSAGGACESWNQNNIVKKATESGECDGTSVLSVYTSHGDVETQASSLKELLTQSGLPTHLLIGDNWIINSLDVVAVQKALGGELVTN